MIRLATEQDVGELKALWDMCFSDPLNYIDFVYNRVAAPGDTLVYDTGGRIVSMMTMLPIRLVYREQSVKGIYIYGAATHKRFQNSGLMTQMLEYAEEYARSMDCVLSVLVPGESYLFDYYGKRGYSADFNLRVVTIKPGMIGAELRVDTDIGIDQLTAKKLYDLRREALSGLPHIEWSAEQLEFVLADAAIYGEHTAHYAGSYGESYAVYGMDRKKRLYFKECMGTAEEARYALMKEVIQISAPREVTAQLPVTSPLFRYEGSVKRYGMAKSLHIQTTIKEMEPYMNLMLD